MRDIKFLKNRDVIFVGILVLLCGVLIVIPNGYEGEIAKDSFYAKAKILAVDNSDLRQHQIVRTGSQNLTVEILEGSYRGKHAHAINVLTGKMELEEVYDQGKTILLEFSVDANGEIRYAVARGNYRLGMIWILMSMFAVLLLIVAGWTGFKAILSFVFSALVIWKAMVPLFLKGYDPVVTGLGLVLLMIGAISFLVGGLTRKGLATFCGSLLGLVLTCGLSEIFTRSFYIHGAVRPFAETLLYSGFFNLNLTKLFLSGVITGSAGAVVDLAMDIAASMDELIKHNPKISLRKHLAAGFSVGRSVIGTMTTTLLFAYSGSYLAMLMLFLSQGVPLINFLNIHFVSAEILNIFVGSFGLITVAPFTVLVSCLIYHGKRTGNKAENPSAVG